MFVARPAARGHRRAPGGRRAAPARAARLVGVDADDLLHLSEGALLGALFESLAVLSLRAYAQAGEARVRYLRTRGGAHEIDAVVVRDDGAAVACEIKLGRTVGDDDVKRLRWLAGQIGDDLLDALVITAGPDAYRRPDGIGVVPLALLGP